jgi:uncharacterized membrane protein YgcG
MALALIMCFAGSAFAQVRDDAGFFSQQAVDQANQSIREMKQQTGRDLMIETFPTIPQERQGEYRPDNAAPFFRRWAQARGTAAHVKGVYILINRTPAYLEIAQADQVKQREFTEADSRELRDQMLPMMKQKQFDQALSTAVDFVSSRFRDRVQPGTAGTATQTPPPPPAGNYPNNAPSYPNATPSTGIHFGGILCPLIAIFGGLWLLRKIFGRRSTGYGPTQGAPYGGGFGPGNVGGGGFGRGILGGILGGMASNWLQNRMSNRGGSNAYGAPPPPPGGGGGFSGGSNDVSYTGGGDAGGSFDSGPSDSGGSSGDSGGSF